MSYTPLTMYTRAVNASLYVEGELNALLGRLRGNYAYPMLARSGVSTIPIPSAFTASTTLTDGTAVTNGLNNTTASFTLSENHVEWSLPPTQWDNEFTSNPANAAVIGAAMADALGYKALDTYVTALISGSPTHSNALATAKTNFTAATGAELAVLLKSMVGAAGRRGGSLVGQSIIIGQTAYSNLAAYGSTLINHGLLLGNPATNGLAAQASYHGVPMFAFNTSSTSFWQQASNPCAFVVHPDGAPLVMDEPFVHGGGVMDAPDGHKKLILMRPFAYSVAQVALIGEVTNPAS